MAGCGIASPRASRRPPGWHCRRLVHIAASMFHMTAGAHWSHWRQGGPVGVNTSNGLSFPAGALGIGWPFGGARMREGALFGTMFGLGLAAVAIGVTVSRLLTGPALERDEA